MTACQHTVYVCETSDTVVKTFQGSEVLPTFKGCCKITVVMSLNCSFSESDLFCQ